MLMYRRLLAASATLALISGVAHAQDVRTAETLRDKALLDRTAWEITEDLTTTIGPRIVGSPAMERAKDWGAAKLKAMGFTNVKIEQFAKPSWTRGEESAWLVGPYPLKLNIVGLGRTIPTPPEGIEAEVALFHTYADLIAAPEGSLKGKIAVITQPMVRAQDGYGYGVAGVSRRAGPVEAAKRGAVALLIRSVSTSDSTVPHTGVTGFGPDVVTIPAAAMGVPEAEQLERLAKKGPLRIKLKLASTSDANDVAWNISGEIKGSEKPDEVIVIGGHLDSWDVGTGALDDATGVAITTAAAKLIGELPKHPKRTIRVVMWGSEESGGSSEAYVAAHKDELAKIVLAGESDTGADRIYSLKLPAGAQKHAIATTAGDVLAPLKIYVNRDPSAHGGSDIEGLEAAGVPSIELEQDASRYFDYHHTMDDTLNKVRPDELAQNVAAWASFLYLVADSDIDFRAMKPAAAAAH
ncbi:MULTISPECIES: M20/M25/M40 family metallo-hydrolase [unclassified Caulobacter]|uniref:M20/M25/M40 family metallo-hydrolase n=1 Tax=unclassified Caulobacter TaxID=2648921 RepID=UPI0006FCB8A7|nr:MULTISPECIES: M20/M25/M40 family metallo-hydrolase [unclassified Caulobacter]KQV56553.1 peptidase M28 [Caulobacter sp. Root342]KQV72188.1 peptidase M28 [Caulobacter sp. Root343]